MGLAIVFWLNVGETPNLTLLCQAGQITNCDGAIPYLGMSVTENVIYVFSRKGWREILVFGAILLLGLLPFQGVRGTRVANHILILAGVAIFLGVLPLFVLGYDYGRWVQMIIFPMSLLVCVAASIRLIRFEPRRPSFITLIYVGTWSFYHAQANIGFMGLLIFPVLAVIVTIERLWQRRF